MDKGHAKFILQSFRADGADADNPDFSEALHMAAEDRELGLWLAEERAHDAFFVEALSAVSIPEGLRDEILSVMKYDGGVQEVNTDLDYLFMGAMADVSPPDGLREQILSVMEVERASRELSDDEKDSGKLVPFSMPWLHYVAVAALLLLGFTFFFSGGMGGGDDEQVDLAEFQMGSGEFLSASYEIDVSSDSLSGVNTWLAGEGMPVADTVPEGLISCGVEGGCKLLLDNGIQGSMIYFKKKGAGDFYLMVLDVGSVKDAKRLSDITQVGLKHCKSCPVTQFNMMGWRDDTKAYLLLSKSDTKQLAELF